MPERKFYLLDTYEGIPEESLSESERERDKIAKNVYHDTYDLVVKNFQNYPGVVVVKGAVPDTLDQIKSDKVCYASIDMNVAYPEIAAGEFLWPKLVSGGIFLLDDYGWRGHEYQKMAWDAFATERGLRILPMPTGQGILLKP